MLNKVVSFLQTPFNSAFFARLAKQFPELDSQFSDLKIKVRRNGLGEILKIKFESSFNALASARELGEALSWVQDYGMQALESTSVDLMSASVSKRQVISSFCESVGLSEDEVAVFGDHFEEKGNDRSMAVDMAHVYNVGEFVPVDSHVKMEYFNRGPAGVVEAIGEFLSGGVIKVLVLDFDGTLNHKKSDKDSGDTLKMDLEASKALKNWLASGRYVVINTGGSFALLEHVDAFCASLEKDHFSRLTLAMFCGAVVMPGTDYGVDDPRYQQVTTSFPE